jgi:hypothetical protein
MPVRENNIVVGIFRMLVPSIDSLPTSTTITPRELVFWSAIISRSRYRIDRPLS